MSLLTTTRRPASWNSLIRTWKVVSASSSPRDINDRRLLICPPIVDQQSHRKCKIQSNRLQRPKQTYHYSTLRYFVQQGDRRIRTNFHDHIARRRIYSLQQCMSSLPTSKAITLSSLSSPESLQNQHQRCRYSSSSNTKLQPAQAIVSDDSNAIKIDQYIPFLLADIGEGIKEVEVIEWYVHVNQKVQQFDVICKVQSDKATVDITSRYDGTIAALGGNTNTTANNNNDDVCIIQVGQPLLYFYQNENDTVPTEAQLTARSSTSSSSNLVTGNTMNTAQEVDKMASPVDNDDDIDVPGTSDTTSNGTTPVHLPKDTNHNYNGIVLTSPAVRKLARDYNIDLHNINGTGPNQRVLKSDVLSYMEGNRKGSNVHAIDDIAIVPSKEPLNQTLTNNNTKDISQPTGRDKVVTLRGYQRSMIHSMTASLSIPHMCLGDEVILNALLRLRQQINDSIVRSAAANSQSTTITKNGINGTKISIMALLIKAISLSFLDYPMVNSIQTEKSLTDGTIVQCSNHNFGIAMDTNRGLVVPLIYQCQNLSIVDIQQIITSYKDKASTNTFTPHDFSSTTSTVSDGTADTTSNNNNYNALTFTVSNIGSIGSGMFVHPLIVPTSLAMVAFGQTKVVPRFLPKLQQQQTSSNDDLLDPTSFIINNNSNPNNIEQQIYEAHVMNITWAGDHRFLDGATLGRLHNKFRYYIEENPMALLL